MTRAETHFKGMGTNFITPSPIAYFDLPDGYMAELSEGTGFENEPLYGLTVVDASGEWQMSPLSVLFRAEADARKHLDLVRRLIKSAEGNTKL